MIPADGRGPNQVGVYPDDVSRETRGSTAGMVWPTSGAGAASVPIRRATRLQGRVAYDGAAGGAARETTGPSVTVEAQKSRLVALTSPAVVAVACRSRTGL